MFRLFLSWLPVCLALIWGSALAEPIPEAPQLPVRSFILEDFHSGRMLAGKEPDTRMEPASITKLMSAYVIYKSLQEGSIKLTDQVHISEKAWRMEGSRMFVEVDSRVSVEDLILGMVIQSGNDATVALAEHVAGSEGSFVVLMNQQAEELGLDDSHFMNATGLPHPDHHMSARDIARLVRVIIAEFPNHYSRYAIKSFTYNDITQHNRNRLLWQDESVDGVKTGHTSSAGYCLVSSAARGDTRLIAVVLGAETEPERFSSSQTLLNYGFRFFETHKLYDALDPLREEQIWKGEVDRLALGPAEDLYVTIPKGRYDDMTAALSINAPIEAPARRGMAFGSVIVTLDDDLIANAPLVALRNVEPAGIVGRSVDQLVLMFRSLLE